MDTINKKKIIIFLNYLTKQTYAKEVNVSDFNEYVDNLSFDEFLNNILLFNFYNEEIVKPEIQKEFKDLRKIDWGRYDFENKFILSFPSKIKLIKNKSFKPEDLFDSKIDDFFSLGWYSKHGSKGTIQFDDDYIKIQFDESNSNFLRELLNIDYGVLNTYYSLFYGQKTCYEVAPDDIIYLYNYFNDENKERINKLLEIIGEAKTTLENENDMEKVIDLFEKYIDYDFSDVFYEYRMMIDGNACDKVEDDIKSHLNSVEGVKFIDDKQINVTYDFLINFLIEHPEIKTFSDLKNYNFIEDEYSSEFIFEDIHNTTLTDEQVTELNNKLENDLDSKIWDFEDEDNEYESNILKFKRIIKDLKFNEEEEKYIKIIPNYGVFTIDPIQVSFLNQKLLLNFVGNDGKEKLYRIPFDDVGAYITNYKLMENLIRKIKNNLIIR